MYSGYQHWLAQGQQAASSDKDKYQAAHLALSYYSTPPSLYSAHFTRDLADPNNNPIDIVLKIEAKIPADNMTLAIARIAKHHLEDFKQHQTQIINAMKQNRHLACVWASAYIDARKILKPQNNVFNEIINNTFFKNNVAVMSKFYNISKKSDPFSHVHIDNNLRIRATQLILTDTSFTPAILALGVNAKKDDFADIVNTHHAKLFTTERTDDEPQIKKQKLVKK
ncbi:MAG: hypothetical protein ACHQAX_03360 [Gammaproteobacteria bacterium]